MADESQWSIAVPTDEAHQELLNQLAALQRDKERLDFMERMRQSDHDHGFKWNAWTYRADQTIRDQLDASMKAGATSGVPDGSPTQSNERNRSAK